MDVKIEAGWKEVLKAEFTKAYALQYGAPIHPAKYAVAVEQVEKEKEGVSLQQNEVNKEEKKNG